MNKHLLSKSSKLFCLADCLIYAAKKKFTAPVILDIGARGGLPQPWRSMARYGLVKAFGFEPDGKETSLLNKRYSFTKIIPFALGGDEKETEFFITNSPCCSSFLKPNLEILERYPISEHFQLKRVEKVRIRKLENLVHDGLIPPPKYLKIDVQGYEYEVLKGAGELLHSSVLCIELEAHFIELYLGEKTFVEVKSYLEEFDFILCDLRPQGEFGGEIVEADCFFIKNNKILSQDKKNYIKFWKKANKITKSIL